MIRIGHDDINQSERGPCPIAASSKLLAGKSGLTPFLGALSGTNIPVYTGCVGWDDLVKEGP